MSCIEFSKNNCPNTDLALQIDVSSIPRVLLSIQSFRLAFILFSSILVFLVSLLVGYLLSSIPYFCLKSFFRLVSSSRSLSFAIPNGPSFLSIVYSCFLSTISKCTKCKPQEKSWILQPSSKQHTFFLTTIYRPRFIPNSCPFKTPFAGPTSSSKTPFVIAFSSIYRPLSTVLFTSSIVYLIASPFCVAFLTLVCLSLTLGSRHRILSESFVNYRFLYMFTVSSLRS